ncbi:MAG: LysM peptidoglycan-binding domain-containing protein [Spirochaetes bacterium]|nr:LysM peptidoglycan-binding domain-containing protein [Spirochaetota bacterium]
MKLIKYLIILLLISINIYSNDFIIHIVCDKETLWSISKKYNVSLDEIIKLNDLTDSSKLTSGTQLKIPDKISKPTFDSIQKSIIKDTSIDKSEQYHTYIFKKEDSLWQISRKYGINLKELMELNKIKDPKIIKEGTVLKIEKMSKKDLIEYENNTKKEFEEYTIKKKETLYSISKKFNIPVDIICNYNNITDKSKIKNGIVLKIPKKTDDISFKKSIQNNKEIDIVNYIKHTIKEKETLWSISKKYNISVEKLCEINNIYNKKSIKKEAVLKIPNSVNYLNYNLPADGIIKSFNSTHFKGIHIYTEDDNEKRKIQAVNAGNVSYVDNVPGFGLTVFIRHDDDYISTYSGFEEIYVKQGDKVKNNQLIGKAGSLSRHDKHGILFSIQYKGNSLEFDQNNKKFFKNIH